MNWCIVAGLREEVIVLEEEFSVGRRGFCLWCFWFGSFSSQCGGEEELKFVKKLSWEEETSGVAEMKMKLPSMVEGGFTMEVTVGCNCWNKDNVFRVDKLVIIGLDTKDNIKW
ncbi:hypothetical protein D5086_002750 [Populus alba]|uniref:Uncharacterized protein n=1 Tax=Populus alba TaxID=43335 RepID=A0ACC4D3X2_POPAL